VYRTDPGTAVQAFLSVVRSELQIVLVQRTAARLTDSSEPPFGPSPRGNRSERGSDVEVKNTICGFHN